MPEASGVENTKLGNFPFARMLLISPRSGTQLGITELPGTILKCLQLAMVAHDFNLSTPGRL